MPSTPTSTDPAVLRARARALRATASRLDRSLLVHLEALGGDDTWRGPTAWTFQNDARRAVAWLDDALDDLHRAARTLEAAADAAAAALARGAAGAGGGVGAGGGGGVGAGVGTG